MKNPNGLSREEQECAQQDLEDRKLEDKWAEQLSGGGGAICKCVNPYYRKRCVQCGRPFEPFRCLYCYDLGLVRTGNSGEQGETMPCPQCAVERERDKLRAQQTAKVMPLIGGLIDAWMALPADLMTDPEMDHLAKHIEQIRDAMESLPTTKP